MHDGNHRILSISIDLAGSLFSDFEKILYDGIEMAKREIHVAHSPVYNETLSIEIETLQWVFTPIGRLKQ